MEISNLEKHFMKSTTSFSPFDGASSYCGNQAYVDDTFCTRHGTFRHNGKNVAQISTQTLPVTAATASEFKLLDESHSLCEDTSSDSSTNLGTTSRAIQTMCTGKPDHGSNKSKYQRSDCLGTTSHRGPSAWIEAKTRDSADSIQSEIDDTASMHSFTTSLPRSTQSPLSTKKDDFFSPLLAQADKEELARRFIKMGETREGCRSMKQMGCMSYIVQIMHDGAILTALRSVCGPGQSGTVQQGFLQTMKENRLNMSKVLWNIFDLTSATKSSHDVQIFQSLQVLRRYCEQLFEFLLNDPRSRDSSLKYNSGKVDTPLDLSNKNNIDAGLRNGLSLIFDPPISRVIFIMKLSYDENVKRIINDYGGLYAVAELFILHYRCVLASETLRSVSVTETPTPDEKTLQLLRRFVGFSLINLTYGDIRNKMALIQMPGLIDTIIAQMALDSEEMQQVMALFVRNLCWQADQKCREILKRKNITSIFMRCALKATREDTLKSLLSALWNLSGHCSENRHCICSIQGALSFLVSTLYSHVPDIVESGGGILRNVSSVIATNEDYRVILREKNCLQTLLKQLKAGSLTVVSNACGTLWNLSARNPQDQALLWDLGAVPMLKNLTHSKHTVIAQGSSAALSNLLAHKPARRQKEPDLHGEEKGIVEREFSPKQNGSVVAAQRILASKSIMHAQRRSSQEKSAFTYGNDLDTRNFQDPTHSGSLGKLQTSEFGDTTAMQGSNSTKYLNSRNANFYSNYFSSNPSNTSSVEKRGFTPIGSRAGKDVKVFTEPLPANLISLTGRQNTVGVKSTQEKLSLRDCLKMLGESKSLHSGAGSSPDRNASTASRVPMAQSQIAMRKTELSSLRPVDLKNSSELSTNANKSTVSSLSPDVKKFLGQTRNSCNISSAMAAKCPEELVKSLCNVEDDYGNDDGPVNYSLQFRDEHMTPGIRSPRTEEIYETDVTESSNITRNHTGNFLSAQSGAIPPSAGVQGTKSEGGLSTLSSCVESAGSSTTGRQDVLKHFDEGKLQSILPSFHIPTFHGEHKVDPSLLVTDEDEKPTDFSAIYTEEQLVEGIEPTSLGMLPYSTDVQGNLMPKDADPSADIPVVKREDESSALESKEADDKFDAGATTPGRYYHYKSGRTSGIMTPRTPMDYETPMMFSRSSSLDSVSSIGSLHSSVTSGPTSRMMSGAVSPSYLPDSPSQSMPISPRRSPPPRVVNRHPVDQYLKPDVLNTTSQNVKMSTPINQTARSSKVPKGVSNIKQPGYITSLPQKDELTVYKSEGAMSVMTKFSSLTIDSHDNVQPVGENEVLSEPNAGNSNDVTSDEKPSLMKSDILDKDNVFAKIQAPVIGYVTSLPSSDEINTYMQEGSFSPMTALSEITYIKDHNNGFMKTTGSVFSISNSGLSAKADGAHSVTSNLVSLASRSSATGASVPPEPSTLMGLDSETGSNVRRENISSEQERSSTEDQKSTQISIASKESNDNKMSDSDDSLSSCSDDDLLQQCINQAIPKKPTKSSRSSSKHSSKSGKSSRTKEKSSVKQATPTSKESPSKKNEERTKNNPSPVVQEREKRNLKQRLEAANMKLNGITIAEYMDNLIQSDENESLSHNEQSPSKINKSKQVINVAETLNESYSVKRKLKEKKHSENVADKKRDLTQSVDTSRIQTKHLNESQVVQSKLRVHSYLKEGYTTYATEGTPVEMSRCTSLSNITIESDGADVENLASQLKVSHSLPDVSSGSPTGTYSDVAADHKSHQNESTSSVALTSSGVTDSHDILESLGKQIENMSLATTKCMASPSHAGYTTSVPEMDEIIKYNLEGSVCGGTEFSALTIDSDMKIKPLRSADDKSATTLPTRNVSSSTPPVVEQQSNANVATPYGGDLIPGHIHNWEDADRDIPPCPYNNENDNLGMKEERHNYMIEDTPLHLSGGSLSSLEFGSDDDNDLLNQCISSALPPEKSSVNPPMLVAPSMPMSGAFPMESSRMYSHGAPDGRVDDNHLTSSNSGYRGNVLTSTANQAPQPSYFAPINFLPTREQFLMFQKEADTISMNLTRNHHMSIGLTSTQASQADSLSSPHFSAVTQPSDSFYRMSKQASVPDSDLSISSSILGERQSLVVGHDNPLPIPSDANQRQVRDKSTARFKNRDKPSKKSSSRSSVETTRMHRNHPAHRRDSSSGSSASYRKQQKHRHLSNNSRSADLCNCQVSCAGPIPQSMRRYHGPVSASTSQLTEDARLHPRSRRRSTNSTSKNSLRGCDHNSHHYHHPPRPSRPRHSAKNQYRPGIVQLYPPLKDMNGVLEGVASVAARGDKVVADRTAQYSLGDRSLKSSSSSLIRSATFINENPSEILLENLSQEERAQYDARSSVSSRSQPVSHISSGRRAGMSSVSPRGSVQSMKQNSHNQVVLGSDKSLKAPSTSSGRSRDTEKSKDKKTSNSASKSKPKKVWKGIKKLLSPSDDSGAKIKDAAQKAQGKLVSTKNVNPSPVKSDKAKSVSVRKEQMEQHAAMLTAKKSSSSLSLTSSSENDSSSEADTSAKATQNNITPYGMLPKSPSVNALLRRNRTVIPHSQSTGAMDTNLSSVGVEQSIWRRTPPSLSSSDAAKATSSTDAPSNVKLDADYSIPSKKSSSPKEKESIWKPDERKRLPRSSRQDGSISPNLPKNHPTNFTSPPRTLSPRVVQQVAPFNYKPTQRKLIGEEVEDKILPEQPTSNPDCRQDHV